MTKYILYIIINLPLWGIAQQISGKNLVLDIKKLSKDDSLEHYSVVLLNKSDSILCLLYSSAFNLSEERNLYLCETDRDSLIKYDFKNCNCDEHPIDPAIPFYEGIGILPYEAKIFIISLKRNLSKKEISFDFFYKTDFCYSSFFKEKQRRGWYKKYPLLNKKIVID